MEVDTREAWVEWLPANRYGRPELTLAAARRVVAVDRAGWYVAPFRLGWTVGKTALRAAGGYFHIVEHNGEPMFFPTVEEAAAFLKRELRVERAPVLNCMPL